jgi:CrcB protein
MKLYAAILLGGALGSAARFAMALWIDERYVSNFPWGTFAVNILGSFIIGVAAGLSGPNSPLTVPFPEVARVFIMVGICGGFTTFSSFSLQTIHLMETGQWLLAGSYVMFSVLLCLLATGCGIAIIQAMAAKA